MLPSGMSVSGFSGFVRSLFSSRTSQILFPLAWLIVIMTKAMESIIRLPSIFIQYVSRLIRLPVVSEVWPDVTIIFAPIQLIRSMQVYTVICMTGIFITMIFSAFVKSR